MITNETEARVFCAERCDEWGLARLDLLVSALREENLHQNLVSGKTLDSVWQRHIADSAQLLDYRPTNLASPWIDFGSGAGFPGLVIAAMDPTLHVILVEARRLRVEWLKWMIDQLELVHCRVEGHRAELMETVPAGVISARAFAPLAKAIPMLQRFSTSDTVWLLPKGRSAAQEVAELPQGMRNMFHVEQSVTDPGSGIVIGRTKGQRT